MRERVNVRGSLLLMGLPYSDGRSTGPMRPQRYTTPLRKGWWLQPHAVEELSELVSSSNTVNMTPRSLAWLGGGGCRVDGRRSVPAPGVRRRGVAEGRALQEE